MAEGVQKRRQVGAESGGVRTYTLRLHLDRSVKFLSYTDHRGDRHGRPGDGTPASTIRHGSPPFWTGTRPAARRAGVRVGRGQRDVAVEEQLPTRSNKSWPEAKALDATSFAAGGGHINGGRYGGRELPGALRPLYGQLEGRLPHPNTTFLGIGGHGRTHDPSHATPEGRTVPRQDVPGRSGGLQLFANRAAHEPGQPADRAERDATSG